MTIAFNLSFQGCAGTQINWNIDKQALAEVAANEAGYQFAKFLPNEAEIALKYARTVTTSIEPGDFKLNLNVWKEYVLEKIGADPHYAKQLSRLLPEIELPESTMPDLKWMDKVKPYISEFIIGVEDGLRVSDLIAFSKLADVRYIEFLIGRTLAVGGM